MGSLGNYLENKLLDLVFGAVAFTPGVSLYVALCTAASDAGITELTLATNGYNRQTIQLYPLHWAAAYGGSKTNLRPVVWTGAATANWSAVSYWAMFDHPTNTTNMYAWGEITGGLTVLSGQHAIIPAGVITITMD